MWNTVFDPSNFRLALRKQSILTIITICKEIDRVSCIDDIAGKEEHVRVELTPALTMGLYGQRIWCLMTELWSRLTDGVSPMGRRWAQILTIITICKDVDQLSCIDDTAGKGEHVRVELFPALTMGLYGQGICGLMTRLKPTFGKLWSRWVLKQFFELWWEHWWS